MEFMHHREWKDALFLHYRVSDPQKLQTLLPDDLELDLFKGDDSHDGTLNGAYVSAFKANKAGEAALVLGIG